MRRIVNINISKSLKLKKLIFKEDWDQKLDRFVSCFFPIAGIYIFCSIYFVEMKPNDEFIKYIIPFAVLFFTYSFYRTVLEKQLIEIKTPLNTEANRKVLLEFAEKKSFEIFRNSKECLIFRENSGITISGKLTVILIRDNFIYFTILKDGFRMNPPVLFSHISFKKEMEKYFDSLNASL